MPWLHKKKPSIAPESPVIRASTSLAQILSPKTVPKPAPTLNYDVLFIIFMMSLVDWERANLTLASVCRNWRHAALATPQIWSRINFDAFVHPDYHKICLERSGTAPLHVGIPLLFSSELAATFPSITARIICMKITDSYRFLCNQFPTLERLELVCSVQDLTEDKEGRRFLAEMSRFPRLRELFISETSGDLIAAAAIQSRCFWALQRLAIPCDNQRYWIAIVKGVSRTLVSLHLDVRYRQHQFTQPLSLPRLRHLQIAAHTPLPLELDIEAPFLESVDEGSALGASNCVKLMLRHPQSVKELASGNFPITLGHYPDIRRLWIRDCAPFNARMIESLKAQICDWPELETVMYYDSSKYRKMKFHEARINGASPPHGPLFWEIWDVIHATGRHITLRDFAPSDMSLPGSVQRKNVWIQFAEWSTPRQPETVVEGLVRRQAGHSPRSHAALPDSAFSHNAQRTPAAPFHRQEFEEQFL